MPMSSSSLSKEDLARYQREGRRAFREGKPISRPVGFVEGLTTSNGVLQERHKAFYEGYETEKEEQEFNKT